MVCFLYSQRWRASPTFWSQEKGGLLKAALFSHSRGRLVNCNDRSCSSDKRMSNYMRSDYT